MVQCFQFGVLSTWLWLWQVILDMQLSSMKAYNPPNFGQDPSLHFITQRYAMLTTSLLLLNADYQVWPCQTQFTTSSRPCTCCLMVRAEQCKGRAMSWWSIFAQDGQMDHNIDRLRFAAMECLLRLSKRYARRRLGTIFLINNFHHVVQVPLCS